MHRVLKKLYRDHSNFNQLMDVLEQQLDKFTQDDPPAFDLLTDLIDYTSNYVDTIHHPIEDQLYQTVLARTDNGREIMEKLLGDHQVIMNMTRQFRKALVALKQGDGISKSEVEKIGWDYANQQRTHQQFEELDAYPLLREELNTADFDIAAGALPADEDPLMDKDMKHNYPILFAYIAQEK